MFVITKVGRYGRIIFLVDRKKSKRMWWTKNLNYAMIFKKIDVARYSLNKLVYGELDIWSLSRAENYVEDYITYDVEDDFHPCDSYSLGQD